MREYRKNIDKHLGSDDLFAGAARALSPDRRGLFYACGEYVLEAAFGRRPGGMLLACGPDTSGVQSLLARDLGLAPVAIAAHPGVYHLASRADGARSITLVPMGATGVEGHLRHATFTVVAMAVDLADRPPFELIDPLGGIRDLDAGCLNAASERSVTAFPDALTATHLCHQYGLYPEKRTREALREVAGRAGDVKQPRTWRMIARLFEGLGLSGNARFLRWIGALGALLPELEAIYEVPQNYYHHLGVWEHTMEVMDRIQEMIQSPPEFFPAYGDRVKAHLDVSVEAGVSRRSYLAFSALIHDIGKGSCMSMEPSGRIRFQGHQQEGVRLAGDIASRMGLGHRGRSRLVGMVGNHMRLGFLMKDGESAGTRLEMVRELGDCCPEVVLLSLADRMATRGEAATGEAMERFRRLSARVLGDYYWNKDTPALVSGSDVLMHAGAQPEEVGRTLSRIRVAQREATVSNRGQALEYLAPGFSR